MSTKHQWVRVKTGGGTPAAWMISEITENNGDVFHYIAGIGFAPGEIAEFGAMIPHPEDARLAPQTPVPYMPPYPGARREGIERESPEWFVANMARLVHGDDPRDETAKALSRDSDSDILDNMIAWARIIEAKATGDATP